MSLRRAESASSPASCASTWRAQGECSCRRTAMRRPRHRNERARRFRQVVGQSRRHMRGHRWAPEMVAPPPQASECGTSRRSCTKIPQHPRVAERAVPRVCSCSPWRSHHCIQIVAHVLGEQAARQIDRAQTVGGKRHVRLARTRCERTSSRNARCARRTPRRSFSPHLAAISANRGAPATMASPMPVKVLDVGGIGHSGLTSELHSSSSSPFGTRTMPISVIRSYAGLPPVVSKSTNAMRVSQPRPSSDSKGGTDPAGGRGTRPRIAGSGALRPGRSGGEHRSRSPDPLRPLFHRSARR